MLRKRKQSTKTDNSDGDDLPPPKVNCGRTLKTPTEYPSKLMNSFLTEFYSHPDLSWAHIRKLTTQFGMEDCNVDAMAHHLRNKMKKEASAAIQEESNAIRLNTKLAALARRMMKSPRNTKGFTKKQHLLLEDAYQKTKTTNVDFKNCISDLELSENKTGRWLEMRKTTEENGLQNLRAFLEDPDFSLKSTARPRTKLAFWKEKILEKEFRKCGHGNSSDQRWMKKLQRITGESDVSIREWIANRRNRKRRNGEKHSEEELILKTAERNNRSLSPASESSIVNAEVTNDANQKSQTSSVVTSSSEESYCQNNENNDNKSDTEGLADSEIHQVLNEDNAHNMDGILSLDNSSQNEEASHDINTTIDAIYGTNMNDELGYFPYSDNPIENIENIEDHFPNVQTREQGDVEDQCIVSVKQPDYDEPRNQVFDNEILPVLKSSDIVARIDHEEKDFIMNLVQYVSLQNISSLQGSQFIDSEIIDFVTLSNIFKFSPQEKLQSILFLPIRFFDTLAAGVNLKELVENGTGLEHVMRNCKNHYLGAVDVFQKDVVVIPIGTGNHYVLAVIVNARKALEPERNSSEKDGCQMYFFDSNRFFGESKNNPFLIVAVRIVLEQYMEHVCNFMRNTPTYLSCLEISHVENLPQQLSGSNDCAIFVNFYLKTVILTIGSWIEWSKNGDQLDWNSIVPEQLRGVTPDRRSVFQEVMSYSNKDLREAVSRLQLGFPMPTDEQVAVMRNFGNIRSCSVESIPVTESASSELPSLPVSPAEEDKMMEAFLSPTNIQEIQDMDIRNSLPVIKTNTVLTSLYFTDSCSIPMDEVVSKESFSSGSDHHVNHESKEKSNIPVLVASNTFKNQTSVTQQQNGTESLQSSNHGQPRILPTNMLEVVDESMVGEDEGQRKAVNSCQLSFPTPPDEQVSVMRNLGNSNLQSVESIPETETASSELPLLPGSPAEIDNALEAFLNPTNIQNNQDIDMGRSMLAIQTNSALTPLDFADSCLTHMDNDGSKSSFSGGSDPHVIHGLGKNSNVPALVAPNTSEEHTSVTQQQNGTETLQSYDSHGQPSVLPTEALEVNCDDEIFEGEDEWEPVEVEKVESFSEYVARHKNPSLSPDTDELYDIALFGFPE